MSEDPRVQEALNLYRVRFGADPDVCVYAPGRVNLIGEHTDYNDGFVLPFALPFRTIIVGSLIKDGGSNKASTLISASLKGGPESNEAVFVVDANLSEGTPKWANYVKGTIVQYLKELPEGFAFNAAIVSDVPIGSGLSSSASLEVATATLLERLCNITSVTGVSKALRCQQAEHTFAHNPCGIMDQYISSMGKAGNLLLIDCRSQNYQLIPFGSSSSSSNGPVVLVTNSNIKHNLAESEYPVRVKQCKEAVAILKKTNSEIEALRDATMDMIPLIEKEAGKNSLVVKRARHCIGEDKRTLDTVEALKKGDYVSVGKYMTESHRSLQNDYEVSCSELDQLVDASLKIKGVYGSRMTGGGFGGCTVTLVDRSAVPALKAALMEAYFNCEFYEAEPSEGAGEIILDTKKGSSLLNWLVPASVLALAAVIVVSVVRSRR